MHSFFLYVDWIHFQCSCRQSNVKWTHLHCVFQLAFVFISRISAHFWFVGRIRWLVSVWCRFLLGVFSNRKSRIIWFLAYIIKLLSNIMSLALLSFKSIKHFDLRLCYQQSSLFSKTFPKFPQNCLLLLEYFHFKQKKLFKALDN